MDKKSLMNLLKQEHESMKDFLLTYSVPETIEDNYEEYLITNNNKTEKNDLQTLPKKSESAATSLDELQERLNVIKNKMKGKKHPTTEKTRQRKEAKKLKKNKELKKVLISAAKSLKNQQSKQAANNIKTDEEQKPNVNNIKPKALFNEEGKIVFSKVKFSEKQKNSHQNPRDALKQLKKTDKKLNELKAKGENEKAAEIKNELSWKKAFDKIEGKKVKDDPQLLYKAIKKRKLEKKKSKKEWQERKQKVEHEISSKQKKRQENINKRIKDTQTRKLKKAAKRGRIIPGF